METMPDMPESSDRALAEKYEVASAEAEAAFQRADCIRAFADNGPTGPEVDAAIAAYRAAATRACTALAALHAARRVVEEAAATAAADTAYWAEQSQLWAPRRQPRMPRAAWTAAQYEQWARRRRAQGLSQEPEGSCENCGAYSTEHQCPVCLPQARGAARRNTV